MPTGEIRLVQGYEPFALDELIKIYKDELIKIYKEEEIKTNRIDFPQIKYICDNKNKYYHPDIYIPHENRIIEIKSEWTYKLRPNIIMDKGNACKEKGYNFEIWIYNYKKEKQIIKL